MRLALIHKPDAGDGHHDAKSLLKELREAGHEVHAASSDDDWRELLSEPLDAAVAAGGDGTVGKVALELIGRDLPLGILPLGTANNLARHTGWDGDASGVIARLADARPEPFDVGVARGPWGVRHFVEGFGLGAFVRAMLFAKSRKDDLLPAPDDVPDRLARDLRIFQTFVADDQVGRWDVTADGERIEGDFVLLEALNIRMLGPNVALAPEAQSSDGLLDLVTVGDAERARLARHIERLLDGGAEALDLPVRRVRSVHLKIEASRVRIDDSVWPGKKHPPPAAGTTFEVDLSVQQGALRILRPA